MSKAVRKGSAIFVYTMTKDGIVNERTGIVSGKYEKFIIATLGNGQRICLDRKQCEIHNNAMWSSMAQKNVYINKMLDVLYDRCEDYEKKLYSVRKRIARMRECAEVAS